MKVCICVSFLSPFLLSVKGNQVMFSHILPWLGCSPRLVRKKSCHGFYQELGSWKTWGFIKNYWWNQILIFFMTFFYMLLVFPFCPGKMNIYFLLFRKMIYCFLLIVWKPIVWWGKQRHVKQYYSKVSCSECSKKEVIMEGFKTLGERKVIQGELKGFDRRKWSLEGYGESTRRCRERAL